MIDHNLNLFHSFSCRWVVENQIGKKDLIIDDCDSKQSVYVFGSKDSVLQIQGLLSVLKKDLRH